ncbi:uncharacterized protein LOC131953997 [Physella acuta]|uniref:uncharacterized protein LOC131953997 n=1 Tax=Physella acuta TaxID=109671 RepID=UPI0027DE82A9|nr:uncharacterized protein LOC131953997 [Physella acuta]XP_059173454.1 uncharacterized protein LOC131953997 [Physella acuta]
MYVLAFVGVVVAVLVCWLAEDIQTDTNFTCDMNVPLHDLVGFLRNPNNLIQVHPRIEHVFNVQTENNGLTFQIVEDFGYIIGKKTFKMSVFYLTEDIQFVSFSDYAYVLIRLKFKVQASNAGGFSMAAEARPEDEHSMIAEARPEDEHVVQVHGTVHVRARRFLNAMTGSQVSQVWQQMLTSANKLLTRQ